MKSIVQLDIEAPRAGVAALFFDPTTTPKWMDDLDRIEPISGKLGMPGSRYRMVPKEGSMVFDVTVVSRNPPTDVQLHLDGSNSTVEITDRFVELSSGRTRLISEEIFRFKGLSRLFDILARPAIRRAHRRHMEGFKRFAERTAAGEYARGTGS
jgi:hypothetical protein